jgi:hypothetical protein
MREQNVMRSKNMKVVLRKKDDVKLQTKHVERCKKTVNKNVVEAVTAQRVEKREERYVLRAQELKEEEARLTASDNLSSERSQKVTRSLVLALCIKTQ